MNLDGADLYLYKSAPYLLVHSKNTIWIQSVYLIMNVNFLTECACFQDDRIWYFTWNYNSLNWIDKRTGKSGSVGTVPWENFAEKRLYDKLFCINNKVILMPRMAHYITIYDTDRQSLQKIDHRFESKKTSGATCYRGQLYFLSISGCDITWKGLLSLDCKTMELKVVSTLSYLVNNYKNFWTTRLNFVNDVMWFCIGNTNTVISLNLKDYNFKIGNIGESKGQYYQLIACTQGLFSVDFQEGVGIMFTYSGRKIKEYKLDISFEKEEDHYYDVCYIDNRIFVNYTNLGCIFEIGNCFNYVKKKIIQGGGFMVLLGNIIAILPTKERESFLLDERELMLGKIPFDLTLSPPIIEVIDEQKGIDLSIFVNVVKNGDSNLYSDL